MGISPLHFEALPSVPEKKREGGSEGGGGGSRTRGRVMRRCPGNGERGGEDGDVGRE